MTRADLLSALSDLDINVIEFSTLLGVSYSQAKAWGGNYPIPRWVRLVLFLLRERGHARDLIDFHTSGPAGRG